LCFFSLWFFSFILLVFFFSFPSPSNFFIFIFLPSPPFFFLVVFFLLWSPLCFAYFCTIFSHFVLLICHSFCYIALLLHCTLMFCFSPCYFTSLCCFISWLLVLSCPSALSCTTPCCSVSQHATKYWAFLI
jgi:hypothetical protein